MCGFKKFRSVVSCSFVFALAFNVLISCIPEGDNSKKEETEAVTPAVADGDIRIGVHVGSSSSFSPSSDELIQEKVNYASERESEVQLLSVQIFQGSYLVEERTPLKKDGEWFFDLSKKLVGKSLKIVGEAYLDGALKKPYAERRFEWLIGGRTLKNSKVTLIEKENSDGSKFSIPHVRFVKGDLGAYEEQLIFHLYADKDGLYDYEFTGHFRFRGRVKIDNHRGLISKVVRVNKNWDPVDVRLVLSQSGRDVYDHEMEITFEKDGTSSISIGLAPEIYTKMRQKSVIRQDGDESSITLKRTWFEPHFAKDPKTRKIQVLHLITGRYRIDWFLHELKFEANSIMLRNFNFPASTINSIINEIRKANREGHLNEDGSFDLVNSIFETKAFGSLGGGPSGSHSRHWRFVC